MEVDIPAPLTSTDNNWNIIVHSVKDDAYVNAMQYIYDNEFIVAVTFEGDDVGADGPISLIQVSPSTCHHILTYNILSVLASFLLV